MSLVALQRDFRSWLLIGELAQAAPFGEQAAAGLAVYQNNYRAQLMGCLKAGFPHTLAWLGEGAFETAAARHIDRVPPSSWTLDAYARDFPDGLGRQYPDDPEVRELAWLEMALGEAFVAPDSPPLEVAGLEAIDWERAVLRFTLSIDVAPLTSNACAIWSALNAGEMPPTAEPLPGETAVLVWREGTRSRFRAIDADERDALLLARADDPYGALCARTAGKHGDEQGLTLASGWLASWLGDGLIVGISV